MRATLIPLLFVGILSISGSTWGQPTPIDPAEAAFNEMMAKPGDYDAALRYARVAKKQRDQALLNMSRFLVLRAQLALASEEPGLAGLISLAALPTDSNKQDRPLWLPGMATLAEANAADLHRVTLIGHTGRINSATWSPDGARIVTTSVDGTARVWDATTGRPLAILGTLRPGLPQDSASSAAWSPDGKRILTSFEWMSQVFVWDSQSALPITTFYGGGRRLLKSAWSPNGTRLATIAENATLIWDARNGEELVSLQGSTEQVTNVDWSPDGQRMLTVSVDGAGRIWDAMTGHLIAVLEGNSIKTAAWSPDGEHIVTAGADFGLWDAHTGALLYSAGTLASPLEDAAWSPEGSRILTRSETGVAVWNPQTKTQRTLVSAHDAQFNGAAWSPDGRRILTSTSNDIRIWDRDTGALLEIIARGHIIDASWAPNGARVVSVSDDNVARVWDAQATPSLSSIASGRDAVWSDDGTRIFTTDGANARIWDADSGNAVTTVRLHEDETFAEWRRDGARFAVIAGNDTKVRESATGAELALLQGHSGRVNSAKWSPDGTRIVTASDDHTVRIWDAATGSPIAILGDLHRKATICPPDCRLEDYIGPVTNADWSPDGTRILANLGNKFARVWDANRGRIVHNIYGASGTILWSPDGKQVLSFSPGGDLEDAVYVWGADAGATDLSISRLQGQVKGLNRVVWSPDGTRILTASKDGTAGVWDAKTGVRLAALKGHSKPVTSAEWSPDGTRLVTGSVDETVRVWDAHTWAEVHIQHHPGAIIRAVWSPDSSRILTTSSDNTAHVLKAWPLLTADTVLHSSVTAFRVLNGDERSSLFLDSGSPSSTAPELMTAATGEEPEILCDRLASTPFDPEKTSVSIAFLDIDFTKAVRACEAAAKAHPHDLKFQYERARVHALWYLVPADYIAFHAFQRTDMAATESVGGPTGRGSVSPSIARYRGDMILGTALSVRAIAERGYAAAIADLGQAYEFGDGVKRDPAEALRLYKQASEKGFLPAFAAVALIYSNGLAGIVDHQEAMRWLERGAAAGDPFSHIRLAELSEEGNRIPKDVEQALLHWIIAVRLFEKLGEGDSESAIVARVRRGSIARGLSPSVVVRIARQAAN